LPKSRTPKSRRRERVNDRCEQAPPADPLPLRIAVRHPGSMPWEPCPCWKSSRRCDRCLQDTISAVAPHCVGYALAEHIARTRPHLINTPRFDELPWPTGYDFTRLARRWLSEVKDERAVAVLVPQILAYAREGWEQSGNINAVREGRLPLGTWIRRIERAKSGR
jgi:hypothetical protein